MIVPNLTIKQIKQKIPYPLKAIYIFILISGETVKNICLSLYCYHNIRVYLCNHFTIGIWTLYKQKTKFPHPIGIVIGINTKIGIDCTIYQNVTIGTKETNNFRNAQYPKLGNNVTIFPNSILIGDIKIGDNVTIGAGTIVTKDIPSNCIAYGNPVRFK